MNLQTFQHTIENADRPVIVDLWAPWCAPCRQTKPILEKLGAEYDGRVTFLAVNADEAAEVVQKYKVLGIPTVLSFRDGVHVKRVTGAQDEPGYRALFEGLSTGSEVRLPLTTLDRGLRLGAGLAFLVIAVITQSWIAAVAGGLLAFLGVYDRCPLWQALTARFRPERSTQDQ